MGSFAGWQFLTNSCWLFNTQGINILINLFFGVTLNAARGIANQVDAAIQQFVNNFMTALNPQITKNYASGNMEEMFKLICAGAKFSYFLLLLFAIPILFETNYILTLWLKNVPDYTIIFFKTNNHRIINKHIGRYRFNCMYGHWTNQAICYLDINCGRTSLPFILDCFSKRFTCRKYIYHIYNNLYRS